MNRLNIKSALIVVPVLSFLFWMIYFFAFEMDYKWHWDRIPDYFVYNAENNIKSDIDGVVKKITINTESATIEIHGNNSVKSYQVSKNKIYIKEGQYIIEDQPVGYINEVKVGVMLEGLWITIKASLLAITFSTSIGIFVGYLYFKQIPLLNPLIRLSVGIVRGIPLLWQILFGYFFLIMFLNHVLSFFCDMSISRLGMGIFILSINSGANITQILISREEKYFVGLHPHFATSSLEFVPKLILKIQDIINESTNTIKDSSLLSLIVVAELTKMTREVMSSTSAAYEIMTICVLIYIVLILMVAKLLKLTISLIELKYKVTS